MTYRFGGFTVNSNTRQLLADGGEVHLSPKAFELLLILIERRSRALSKAELQELLWPSTFVGETNLPTLVAEIRRALGESAHESTYVRTVHRFGYRFVTDVAEMEAARTGSVIGTRMYVTNGERQFPLSEGATLIGRGERFIRTSQCGIQSAMTRASLTCYVGWAFHCNRERLKKVPMARVWRDGVLRRSNM